tara:strand:+ start:955 stop:1350 length:396 start_codon:yes stop_codon:yes gene_type:complete
MVVQFLDVPGNCFNQVTKVTVILWMIAVGNWQPAKAACHRSWILVQKGICRAMATVRRHLSLSTEDLENLGDLECLDCLDRSRLPFIQWLDADSLERAPLDLCMPCGPDGAQMGFCPFRCGPALDITKWAW